MKRTVVLTSRQHRTITLVVEGGRILTVSNQSGVRFPFVTGQTFNRSIETWAETNGFLFDGVDLTRQNRKIFGIRIQDVPSGHPLRIIYPHKFR